MEILYMDANREAQARNLAAFIRTHQAARERELREKLEGLRDDCDEKETSLRNLGEPEIADEVQRHTEQLNALLASHWPAQKEIE